MRFSLHFLLADIPLAALLLGATAWSRPSAPQGDAAEQSGADDESAQPAGELVEGANAAGALEPGPVRYRGSESVEELLARWTANGLAERLQLGESAGGRALIGVVIAAPGPTPAAERTTVLIVGGLDGRSCAGAETAVHVIEDVLAAADRLPPDVAVVVVPWANPDGLARTLEGLAAARNDTPVDDDQDGQSDEDGPDDVDGDGAVLSMLVLDSHGPFARSEDARFLRPATSNDRERWRLVPEGRDDDGDGRFNEDGPGGLRLDTNFPMGWVPGLESGGTPLSQPESRALAGLARSRRVAVALFLQGNHGDVAIPGGTPETRALLSDALSADAQAWRELGRVLGRPEDVAPRDLLSAQGTERSGHPVDWLYSARGVLSVEWALWGPEHGREPVRGAAPREGSFLDQIVRPHDLPADSTLRGVAPDERRWARWLDDTRGGIGYVDWLPVELGDGVRALVGGWEPLTCINPPEELLPGVVNGAGERVLQLVEGLPRLALELEPLKRQGGVVELSLRVRNDGRLPTGAGPSGSAGGGLLLELELPEGVELLAGERSTRLEHLSAGAASESMSWLFEAKEHLMLRVVLESAWGGRVEREVRL